jgi:hypothetical protein
VSAEVLNFARPVSAPPQARGVGVVAENVRLRRELAEARAARDELGNGLIAALEQLCATEARASRAERVVHSILRNERKRPVLDEVRLSVFGETGK